MALQLTLTTENGITLEDAYIKVTSVFIQPKERMQILVSTFADKDQALPVCQEAERIAYDHTASNPLQQAYEYLKTTDKYKFAADC
jgi:hypothetical protein